MSRKMGKSLSLKKPNRPKAVITDRMRKMPPKGTAMVDEKSREVCDVT